MTTTTRLPQPNDRPAIYYTATIITFDGSDTNAYGEACEPGHGYREDSGWWDPKRSYWTVQADRARVTPDICPDRADPGQWLAARLAARLGDLDDYDGGHTFRGAREAIHPGRLTGPRSQQPGAVLGTRTLLGDALAAGRLRPPNVGQRTISATAHADGFSDNDLRTAAARLGLVPDDDRPPTGDAPETSP